MPTERKTIELRLALYTNELAQHGDNHAWDQGVVYTIANPKRGIKAEGQSFNSIAEVSVAVEKLLAKAGLKIHAGSGRTRKLIP